MSDLKLPILIYISKIGCPGCMLFNEEWEKIKEKLSGQARLIRFNYNAGINELHPSLVPLVPWFPMILLTSPRSYFRLFTHDDQINNFEGNQNYRLKAFQYNVALIPRETPAGGRYDCESILGWYTQAIKRFHEIDEATPPAMYPEL